MVDNRLSQKGNEWSLIGFRCLWLLLPIFERVIAQIFDDPGVIRSGWKQPVTFPKTQSSVANLQYLSGFRLADACAKPFLLEMLTKGCRLFCDWKTTSPNRLNVSARHAHTPVAKRQHRALQTGKCPASQKVRHAKFKIIWDEFPGHCLTG
jgi:hypothetical protein